MRKTKEFEIKDGDATLRVRVTRMPAQAGMDFVTDACCILGVESFGALLKMDKAQAAQAITFASRKNEDIKCLLDRLLACCERVTDAGGTVQLSRATIDGQVSEWFTVLQLYAAALGVNFDFFGGSSLTTYREALTSLGQQIRSGAWLTS